jgi:hypothetical protein
VFTVVSWPAVGAVAAAAEREAGVAAGQEVRRLRRALEEETAAVGAAHWIAGHWIAGHWIAGHWIAGHWIAGHWIAGHWIASAAHCRQCRHFCPHRH